MSPERLFTLIILGAFALFVVWFLGRLAGQW